MTVPNVEAGELMGAVTDPIGLDQVVPVVETTLHLSFQATSPVPVGGKIHVIFTDGFAPTEVSLGTIMFLNDENREGTVSFDTANEIHVTLTDVGIAAGETVRLTLDGLATPQSEREESNVLVSTYHSSGNLIDGILTLSLHAISPGVLVSTTPISFSTPHPGVTSDLMVSYR